MIITRTPLRISFFGGGTDYPAWFRERGGSVVATSVDKYIYVTLRYLPPFFDHTIRLTYSRVEHVRRPEEIAHPAIRACLRFMEVSSNVEIHTDADLPARTGLGSSSTFTVGLLNALHAFRGRLASKPRLAREAIHVEHDLIGEKVGCQDQTIAAYGGLNRIDFSGEADFSVSPLPLSAGRLRALEERLMLFYSGISRSASRVVAEQLENMAKREKELAEMGRMAGEGVRLLTSGSDWRDFGALLHEGWTLKRSLSSSVSTPLIDEAYELARRAGAAGGKLLGAGGGGFLLIFAEPEVQPRVREALSKLLYVPVRLETTGSQVIVYQPDAGADALPIR